MSFDIFLQPFSAGHPSLADAAAVEDVLDAHVVASDQGWARLKTRDGDVELHGYDSLERGFMVNHATGTAIWDILVTVASIGPFAIMPIGCQTCVTDADMLAELPPEIAGNAVVVSSGTELLRVVEA